MVQIVQGKKKQSFGDQIMGGFGNLLNQGNQLYQQKQIEQKQQQQQEQQKENMNKLGLQYGIEGLGNYSPEIQKELVSKSLQGKNEQIKLQGKQGFLNDIFSKNQQKENSNQLEEQNINKSEMSQKGFDPTKISDEDLARASAVDPNVGRALTQAKDVALRQQSEYKKIQQKEKEFFHTESKKYDESLTEQSTAAEKKNRALESQLKLAHKLGKWDRVVSALAGQSKWGSLLKSKDAQEFDSYALPQMEGLRQVLGGVLSDSDIRLIMQKVVTSDKTPEANERIAKYLMSENNLLLGKKQIADELKRNNGGYRPANYDSEIKRIFNERYGNQIKSEYEDLMALPDDPKKLNNVGRRTVPPGTPLGEKTIQMYFELANGDPIKATELAEEDGYDVPK